MNNILLNLWVTIMNNETKDNSNYEDNTITKESVEDVEADFTLENENDEASQKIDEDEEVV